MRITKTDLEALEQNIGHDCEASVSMRPDNELIIHLVAAAPNHKLMGYERAYTYKELLNCRAPKKAILEHLAYLAKQSFDRLSEENP